MIQKKSILIIGGTGFIGYHLAKRCIGLNWSVTCISKNKPITSRKLKKVTYRAFDLGKKKNLKKIKNKKFNYVVNLGGYIEHKNSHRVYNNHYLIVKNLLTVFKNDLFLEALIQIGSSAEYGFTRSPHNELDKERPASIYGKTKLLATKLLFEYYKKYNLPIVVLRFYQIYGPNQNIDRFIPLLINACLNKTTLPISHGKQKRDFLYVNDAIEAIIKTLKKRNSIGKIINIGTGKPISLKKIINIVSKKIKGGQFLFGKIKLRIDEPLYIYPSIENSKKILNWKSKISFKSGIKKTINYYKNLINN